MPNLGLINITLYLSIIKLTNCYLSVLMHIFYRMLVINNTYLSVYLYFNLLYSRKY